ncbi:MAG TPA: HEXXH motif-containing putative peptide modification protein [Steroidobacteraceae bacterium]|nr:HEXXH motif-containing putative peptide modification protein [Steroidobacteraceae bacterium]
MQPSHARAMALELKVRQRLADSLRYILSECEGVLSALPASLDSALSAISQGPIPPLAFGAYFQLVLALDEDRHEDARVWLSELSQTRNAAHELSVRDDAEVVERHRELMALADTPLELQTATAEKSRGARALIDQAVALLEQADPELREEIRILVREIVLVEDSPASHFAFDGAASLMAFGSIVLNAASQDSRLAMAQALAHESGHVLLFSFAAEGSLIDDDGEAKYPSPLREDLRPMDGIFHAAFVSARTHRMLEQLMKSNALSEDENRLASQSAEEHRRNFFAALETIETHGCLSARGKQVIEDCAAYMRVARART